MDPDFERHFDQQLEGVIHRELSKLPALKAPETLIPKTLAALEKRARAPWWRQAWTAWPLACQAASIPLGLGCAFLLGIALMTLTNFISAQPLVLRAQNALLELPLLLQNTSLWLASILNAIRGLGQHWIIIGAILICSMYLACIGIGSVWLRVAFPKR